MLKRPVALSLIVSIFLFATLSKAKEQSRASLPEYNLSVSFDIEASKIFGHVQIRALAESELTIHTDDLKIIEANSNGKKFALTKRYLKTYEKLLGKYPYKRLTIVKHFERAGYSMPRMKAKSIRST